MVIGECFFLGLVRRLPCLAWREEKIHTLKKRDQSSTRHIKGKCRLSANTTKPYVTERLRDFSKIGCHVSSRADNTMSASRETLIGDSSTGVSQHLADTIKRVVSQVDAKETVIIGLSGGSLPKFFVQAASLLNSSEINWSRVRFIFCDERLVPFDNADSTYKLYKEGVIGQVDGISAESFVVIDPTLDVEACAKDYEKKLTLLGNFGEPFPSYHLLLLGMGPDGHTCSLFPDHPLLEESARVVAPIADSPKPPAERVTLTLPVLNNARCCAFVSTGDGKKDIIAKILQEGEDFPAGRVRPEKGQLVWILDKAAAANLKQ